MGHAPTAVSRVCSRRRGHPGVRPRGSRCAICVVEKGHQAWIGGGRAGRGRYPLPVASKRTAALEAMIEEATVDAYNDDEQLTGLYIMIEDNLAAPFTTTVLGVEVTVRKVDLTDDSIVAVCVRGRDRQRIDLLDLPLPTPPPDGSEWIDAYRHWAGR
jgi:hypothetical protein